MSTSKQIDVYIENSRRESLHRLESKLKEIYEKYSSSIPCDEETDVIDISTLEVVHSSGFLSSLPDAHPSLMGRIRINKEHNSSKKCYSAKSRSFRTISRPVEHGDDHQKLLEKLELVVLEKGKRSNNKFSCLESIPIEFIYALQSQSQSQDNSKYHELIRDLYVEFVEENPLAPPSGALVGQFCGKRPTSKSDESFDMEDLLAPICRLIVV